MSGGASVQDVTKRIIGIRVPLELSMKILSKFAVDGDKSETQSFIRALEQQSEGIQLTATELAEVQAEMVENHKRNERNKITYANKHGTRTWSRM